MFANNHRNFIACKIPNKTEDRIVKIRDLLGKAMGEVTKQINKSLSRSPKKRRSQQSSQSQTICQVLANLKQGYLMIKHSQKINQPHDKFVYLSQDSRYICWKSLDRDDEKRMEVTSIEKVVKQGAEFYIRSNKIRDLSRCLVIISSERRLQLEATSEIEAEYFRYELSRMLKYWKGMRMNYKYNKN